MKKFLFTLAALLAVGSMSADNYFFIDQIENPVPGQEYEVALKAHFDNRVSAFQLELGSYNESGEFLMNVLPAGVEVTGYDKGDDATIWGLNSRGRAASWTSSFGSNDELTRFIGGVIGTDIMYQEVDGELTNCGAPKWEPGDYDEMFYLYIVYSEAYDGSPIVIQTAPSCGQDPRGNTAPSGEIFLRPEWNDTPAQPEPAPEPEFVWDEDTYTMEAVCEDHVVVLKKGDELVSNPYTVEQTYEQQTITFYAYTVANEDESGNSTVVEMTVTVPAKDLTLSNAPTIAVEEGEEVYTVTATGTGTVVLYLENGQRALVSVENPYEIDRPEYGQADLVLNFKASNLDVDPENKIQYKENWAEEQVTVPAKEQVLEKTQDPTVTVTSGNQTKTITCAPNANDPESVIYISTDGGVTFEVYTAPVVLGIGEYDIVVYAVAPGKAQSNDVSMQVIVDENTKPDPTAVNELNGEKAVAGVRYFNMAGQEMQEANGVTIVVTTYTDGTTSAVKVIK